MPLFMDRHFSENPTQEAIELAHQQDLKIQEKYGVKFLTYWFDEERGTTFCLIDAPDEATIKTVHNEAHGDIPNEIIPVDPNTVQLFLGRIQDPVKQDNKTNSTVDSAFRIIMFTDLVDSTAMTTRLGQQKSMHLLRSHNAITRTAIRNNEGREIKHTGDGFMVSFTSTDNASQCAKEIQQGFAEHNLNHPDFEMRVRIGLSAGEPVEENNDLFGSTVQMAARVCDSAKPDQILATQSVFDDANHKQCFSSAGEKQFKGFNDSVSLFEIGI